MDLLLAVGVWALGAWLAYRCTRWACPPPRETPARRAPRAPRTGAARSDVTRDVR